MLIRLQIKIAVVKLAGPGEKLIIENHFQFEKFNGYIISFDCWSICLCTKLFYINRIDSITIFNFASKKGSDWLIEWEKDDANLQQLSEELLIVNVSTIGIHFLTDSIINNWVLLSVWI